MAPVVATVSQPIEAPLTVKAKEPGVLAEAVRVVCCATVGLGVAERVKVAAVAPLALSTPTTNVEASPSDATVTHFTRVRLNGLNRRDFMEVFLHLIPRRTTDSLFGPKVRCNSLSRPNVCEAKSIGRGRWVARDNFATKSGPAVRFGWQLRNSQLNLS